LRELTKSVTSFSWALSLLGVRQVVTLAQRGLPSPAPFDEITRATEAQLDGPLLDAFKAGDRLQRSVVDLAYGCTSCAAPRRGAGGQLGDLATNVVQQSLATLRRLVAGGWR
jgi:hypothetical protein